MSKRRILGPALAIVAILSGLGALSIGPALAAPIAASQTASHSAARMALAREVRTSSARPDATLDGCPSGDLCIYHDTNFVDLCNASSASKQNYVACRNVDESVVNNMSSGKARLYYSPNQGGAWICIDAGSVINVASSFIFDQGSGLAGYGATLNNDVASLEEVTGNTSCDPNL